MARNETFARHTPQSLKHVAQLLKDQSDQLNAAAILLEVDPAIGGIDVRFEANRETGMDYVTSWVNAAKKAAFEARLSAAQGDAPKPKKSDTKR